MKRTPPFKSNPIISLLTLSAYLIEGALGIPVFAKGGGLPYLIGPTAGYLYGMTIAAAVIGYFADLGYGKSIIKCIFPLSLGTAIIFVCGIKHLDYFMAASACSIPSSFALENRPTL